MEGQQDWPYYSLGIAFQKNVGEDAPTPPYCMVLSPDRSSGPSLGQITPHVDSTHFASQIPILVVSKRQNGLDMLD
jgi:hypothetical protein